MHSFSTIVLSILALISTAQAEGLQPAYILKQPAYPFDSALFAQQMGVRPLPIDGSEPSFWRVIDGGSELFSKVELATVRYSCRNNHSVTLIPMVHIGETSYYEHADQVAMSVDHVLFEGVRLDHFFGPPFEVDPRIRSQEDLNELTKARLQTIQKMIVSFYQVTKRYPKNLFEISEGIPQQVPPGFLERGGFDTDGSRFVLTPTASGGVRVAGAKQSIELPSDLPANAVGLPAVAGIDAYNKAGQTAGLTLQSSYEMKSYNSPSSFDADVSLDMVMGTIPQSAKVANNDYRNLVAIVALNDLLTKQTRPQSVAIMYGALHLLKYHQYLVGERLGCKPVNTEWVKAIDTDPKNAPEGSQKAAMRKEFMKGFKALKPTLDPNPLGIL